ncbi:MAG: DUF2147 domain-containing protein [Cyclobacteriaceae bacterium]|nr:DUF2147 domain-containing protein [Cyclobacteriaceae bacterium]
MEAFCAMEANMMMVSFVLLVVASGLVIFFVREQFLGADFQHSLVGVWFSEQMNVRVLIYDVDSVFQGSVVWADSANNSILGTRVLENLKVGMFKKCKGSYIDPVSAKEFDVTLQLKNKSVLKVTTFHKNTHEVAFAQEWKLIRP